MMENHPKELEILELSVESINDQVREVYGHKITYLRCVRPGSATRKCVWLHIGVCGPTECVCGYTQECAAVHSSFQLQKLIFRCFKVRTKSKLEYRGSNSHFGGSLGCVRAIRTPYGGVRPYTFK